MKRSCLHLLPALFAVYTAGAQGIKIMPGTTFKFTGAPYNLVLSGPAHFENNAAIDGRAMLLKATGAATSEIRGSGTLNLSRLLVQKATGQQITLQKTIQVAEGVFFTSGLLHLNGHDLVLADTAALFNESESSHLAQSPGAVQISVTLDAPLAENPGNLGLVITSGANWGNTLIRRSSQPFTNGIGGSSIGRSYSLSPTNNTGLNAFLRMYYLDAELNSLNEGMLDFYRSDNNGAGWTNIGAAGRNTAQNFVNLNGVQSMAFFTLSTTGNPLPMQLSKLEVSCLQQRVYLQWQVANPAELVHFYIEKSRDGSGWDRIPAVIAAVPDAMHRYEFRDDQAQGRYYRLLAAGHDGTISYSSVREANCDAGVSGFVLLENPVHSTARVDVQIPYAIEGYWQLTDMQGRNVRTQQARIAAGASQVSLPVTGLAAGIYQLRLSTASGLLWQTKLVKQ